jgi:hypothetical protein
MTENGTKPKTRHDSLNRKKSCFLVSSTVLTTKHPKAIPICLANPFSEHLNVNHNVPLNVFGRIWVILEASRQGRLVATMYYHNNRRRQFLSLCRNGYAVCEENIALYIAPINYILSQRLSTHRIQWDTCMFKFTTRKLHVERESAIAEHLAPILLYHKSRGCLCNIIFII